MNANNYYEQGVHAFRIERDIESARRLLTRAVKTDPQNEMAWLWLSRTLSDPKRQLQAVERALNINPSNLTAQQIHQKLVARQNGHVSSPPATISPQNEHQIALYLNHAQTYLDQGDNEGAVGKWVDVLDLQVDHEVALREAVKTLIKLKYHKDAKELLWRAIDANTPNLSIYLTMLDLIVQEDEHHRIESLHVKILALPTVTTEVVMRVTEKYITLGFTGQAYNVLENGIEKFPDQQDLLLKMGDLQDRMGKDKDAIAYYQRTAALGIRTDAGKEADKRLQQFAPVITDNERGNMWLAWREAGGILLVFFTLAWMDSSLDMLQIDSLHWMGVLLSIIGGYLLITATSSPRQGFLVRLLGGEVDLFSGSDLPVIQENLRYALGALGAVLLLLALWLTFSNAITALLDPTTPTYPFRLFFEMD